MWLFVCNREKIILTSFLRSLQYTEENKRGDDDYFITIQENTTLFCRAKEGREEVIAVGVWVLQGLRDQPEVVEPHHPDVSGFGNSTGTSAQS